MNRLFAVAVAAMLCATVPVFGDFTATMTGGFGNGGAFYVTTGGSPPPNLAFGKIGSPLKDATFCVEGVTFSTQTAYNATVDDDIEYGKNPGAVLVLTTTTKQLFAQYVFGGLDTIVGVDSAKNKLLQDIFWEEQGVLGYYTNGSTIAERDAFKALYDKPIWAADYVKVLNLWDGTPHDVKTDKQSHLVVLVPAPAAAVLGLLGLSMVGWFKRRMA